MKECKYYVTNPEETLVFCIHKDNSDKYEANCQLEFCPLLASKLKELREGSEK